jgi:hypothetical protein
MLVPPQKRVLKARKLANCFSFYFSLGVRERKVAGKALKMIFNMLSFVIMTSFEVKQMSDIFICPHYIIPFYYEKKELFFHRNTKPQK